MKRNAVYLTDGAKAKSEVVELCLCVVFDYVRQIPCSRLTKLHVNHHRKCRDDVGDGRHG
jgi:hypothetical protein